MKPNNLNTAFSEIINHAHYWNWCPDWGVVSDVYNAFPESYSILTPFAYSYLEELIRSTTSEYGRELYDEQGKIKKYRKVGIKLIELAKKENIENQEYVNLLEKAEEYFGVSKASDRGDNRNNVNHGYMHPRYWDKSSFEKLIYFIASISKYSGF